MALKRDNPALEKIPENEEVFVLRARDQSSPRSVILWIADNLQAPDEKLRDAFECALRMRRHPGRKPAD